MLTVTCAVIINDGKIFIARRNPNQKMGGVWEFPGGKIEKGETTEECIVREIKEEFSIDIRVKKFLGRSFYDYNDFTINLLAYYVEWLSGEMIPVDHDMTAWVDLEEIKEYNLARGDIPFIEIIRKEFYS